MPCELLKIITEHFTIFDEMLYAFTNKYHYHMLKFIINCKIIKIKQLQRFYNKRKTYFPFEESYMNIFFEPCKKRKNFINRCYIAKYPMLILYSYPEYFLEKTNIYNSDIKKKKLKTYINGLPPVKKRTRRHIRGFFNLNCISVRDIIYVGW